MSVVAVKIEEIDEDKRTHVYPINDFKPHVCVGIECWCDPDVLEETDDDELLGVIIVHHRSQ